MSGDGILSTWKVGRKLGVHGSTVRRMIYRGEFPRAFKVGRVWRIPAVDVAEYIEARRRDAVCARRSRIALSART